jgi:hypothetical protein
VFDQINNFVGITHFVVVPRDDFNKVIVQSDASIRVKNGCAGISDGTTIYSEYGNEGGQISYLSPFVLSKSLFYGGQTSRRIFLCSN